MHENCRMCLKDDTNLNFKLFSSRMILNLTVYEVYKLFTSLEFEDQKELAGSKICKECLKKLSLYYKDRCEAITNNNIFLGWGLKTSDNSRGATDVKQELDDQEKSDPFIETYYTSDFVEFKVKSEPLENCELENFNESAKSDVSQRKSLRTKITAVPLQKKSTKKQSKQEKSSCRKIPPGVVCPYCGKRLSRRLDRHIQRVHLKLRPYCCDLCLKTFSTKSVLRDHLLRHAGNRVFDCEKCTESFCTHRDLLIHGRRIHEGPTHFPCAYKECQRDFTSQATLNSHIKNVHLKIRPYVCHCGLGYFAKEMLREHELEHIENLQATFECEFCDKKFTSEYKLKRHTKSQHTFLKLKCNFCEKTCRTERKLREHENVHKNIREYSCTHCEKAYSTKPNLMMHIKDTHFKSKISCELCGSKLARRENYLMHAKSVHKDLEPEAMESLIAKIRTIRADYDLMEYVYG